MSNETGNQSNNTPEDTTPPWERVWNDVKVSVGNAVDGVTAPIKQAVKQPWEQFWGVDHPAPVAPVKRAPDQFEQVFNKLINTESAGRHTTASGSLTTSAAGAEGLTQIMPKTGAKPGFGVEPIKDKSEAEYKRFGRDYLKAMLTEFNGDYEKAIAAYNAGAGSVKRAITKGGEDWKQFLPKKSETLPYLNKILGGK